MDFIVSSFEYFSCKCLNSVDKKTIAGDIDLPPIMAIIPSASDIMEQPMNELICIKTISAVYKEAEDCLEKLKKDSNSISFRYDGRSNPISHIKRIINMHTGLLGNYKHCIKEISKKDCSNSPECSKKLNLLLEEIDKVIENYKQFDVQ